MNYEVVDNWKVKGIILTAESLLQLQEEIEVNFSYDEFDGAMRIYEFLKDCYDKSHNKR